MSFSGLPVLLLVLCSSSEPSTSGAVPVQSPQNVTDAAAGPDKLWHLLAPELQHSLSGLLVRHGAEKSLADPEVDALMSNLLHDELETQWKQQSIEDERAANEAAEFAKAEEERARVEHERQQQELEASRKSHRIEMEAARSQREADRERARKEAEERQRAHDEFMQRNDDMVQKTRARREKSEKKRAEMAELQAKNWAKASNLLAQVHVELEAATDGWRDAPFWDDFFRTSSAASRFSQLGFTHIESALRAALLQPHHQVLVLEPRGASLADRLAGEIRAANTHHVEASAYGAESDDGKDIIVEVGLLDAMAMGGAGEDASKLDALKSASSRLAKLVKPGGTWISVSAVPPALRVPLLGRLSGGKFALPSEKEDGATGTHAVVLSSSGVNGKNKSKAGLRGAQVADMLLYGSEDVHVWAYRMQRGEDSVDEIKEVAPASLDGLLDMIRQQRPATRDDL